MFLWITLVIYCLLGYLPSSFKLHSNNWLNSDAIFPSKSFFILQQTLDLIVFNLQHLEISADKENWLRSMVSSKCSYFGATEVSGYSANTRYIQDHKIQIVTTKIQIVTKKIQSRSQKYKITIMITQCKIMITKYKLMITKIPNHDYKIMITKDKIMITKYKFTMTKYKVMMATLS